MAGEFVSPVYTLGTGTTLRLRDDGRFVLSQSLRGFEQHDKSLLGKWHMQPGTLVLQIEHAFGERVVQEWRRFLAVPNHDEVHLETWTPKNPSARLLRAVVPARPKR